MGEIISSLDRYYGNYIKDLTVSDITIEDLIWLCGSNGHTECEVFDDLKCPFWREHIGCLFRQGKVPREW